MNPTLMDLRLILLFAVADARMYCEKAKAPLELGEWNNHLKQIDSAVVENRPVAISEGQTYVYDNYFPDYTIKYVHVDNLAMRTCGASAAVKSGGVDTSSIMIVLHAAINQEIRSVVDVWGQRIPVTVTKPVQEVRTGNYLQMFKKVRAVSHNRP